MVWDEQMEVGMKVCLCSVLQLQDAIKSRCQIPQDKQVLLISGGENLDPAARVCSYSAGTVSWSLTYVHHTAWSV